MEDVTEENAEYVQYKKRVAPAKNAEYVQYKKRVAPAKNAEYVRSSVLAFFLDREHTIYVYYVCPPLLANKHTSSLVD
jgi:hypothetical protein